MDTHSGPTHVEFNDDSSWKLALTLEHARNNLLGVRLEADFHSQILLLLISLLLLKHFSEPKCLKEFIVVTCNNFIHSNVLCFVSKFGLTKPTTHHGCCFGLRRNNTSVD